MQENPNEKILEESGLYTTSRSSSSKPKQRKKNERIGRQGGVKMMHYHRPKNLRRAMGSMNRMKETARHYFYSKTKESESRRTIENESDTFQQFRIVPRNDESHHIYRAYKFTKSVVVKLAIWSYETSTLKLSLAMISIYFAFIILFSFVLFQINDFYFASAQRQCITSLNYEFTNEIGNFEFLFDLSWTTFSTVGYGVFSSSEVLNCWGIRIVCALEAFMGVMYSACCGSILFARLQLQLADAPVTFSGPMCLHFDEKKLHGARAFAKNPFPTLEFRLLLNNNESGDKAILDANITCSVLQSPHNQELIDNGYLSSRDVQEESREASLFYDQETAPIKNVQLTLETSTLPYFDKIWNVRHYLDASSPLLKNDVKATIEETGVWPIHLNDYKSIRESLQPFQRIVVLFHGVHEVSSSTVTAKTMYKFEDIYLGWRFARVIYAVQSDNDNSYSLKIDKDLLHDIVPQYGGNNEPLQAKE